MTVVADEGAVSPEADASPKKTTSAEAETNPARFFFVEVDVMSQVLREGWTRDELLLYLLLCRGYSPRHHGSLMGEQAARVRLGLTKKRWEEARGALERRGLIRAMSPTGSKAPLTCIAAARRPYDAQQVFGATPREIDGHRYDDLSEVPLKLPWALIDGTEDGAGPILAQLLNVQDILLLVALYGFARSDGIVPRVWAWIEPVGETQVMAVSYDARGQVFIDPERIAHVGRILLSAGLVYAGASVSGRDERVLHLYHTMDTTTAVARGSYKN